MGRGRRGNPEVTILVLVAVSYLLQKLSGPETRNLHVPVLETILSCIMKLCTCTHLFKCAYPISTESLRWKTLWVDPCCLS